MEDVQVSLHDAVSAACTTDDQAQKKLAQLPEHLKKTALYHARPKHGVAMTIERRGLQGLIRNRPEDLISVHLYSDASPVTGTELQGMVIELVFSDGRIRTMVLPGVVMHFAVVLSLINASPSFRLCF